MKEIKAYIKPHKLSNVIEELHCLDGLTGLSVMDVKGFGRGRGEEDKSHIVEDFGSRPSYQN